MVSWPYHDTGIKHIPKDVVVHFDLYREEKRGMGLLWDWRSGMEVTPNAPEGMYLDYFYWHSASAQEPSQDSYGRTTPYRMFVSHAKTLTHLVLPELERMVVQYKTAVFIRTYVQCRSINMLLKSYRTYPHVDPFTYGEEDHVDVEKTPIWNMRLNIAKSENGQWEFKQPIPYAEVKIYTIVSWIPQSLEIALEVYTEGETP